MAVALHHPWRRPTRAARPAPPPRAAVGPPPAAAVVPAVLSIRGLRLRSVAAFAFVFLLGAELLGVGAAVGGWYLAVRWGVVEHVEELMVDLGFETFEVDRERLQDVMLVVAGAGLVVGTLLAVLAAALFNLVNRATGGVKVRVLERRPPE